MQVETPNLKSWLIFGWRVFKNHYEKLIPSAIINCFWYIVFGILGRIEHGWQITIVLQITIWPVFIAGWWFFCLRFVRGEEPSLGSIFSGFKTPIKTWAIVVLLFIVAIIGFILFIIPGILLILKYGMVLFVAMDKKLTPIKAMKFSDKITYGYKTKLLCLLFVGLLLSILTWPFAFGLQNLEQNYGLVLMIAGIVPYLIGVLVVAPWLVLSWATAYEELSKRYQEITQATN